MLFRIEFNIDEEIITMNSKTDDKSLIMDFDSEFDCVKYAINYADEYMINHKGMRVNCINIYDEYTIEPESERHKLLIEIENY